MSDDHPFFLATPMIYRRTLARSSGVFGRARPTAAIAAWSVPGPGPRPLIGNRGLSESLLLLGAIACPIFFKRWRASAVRSDAAILALPMLLPGFPSTGPCLAPGHLLPLLGQFPALLRWLLALEQRHSRTIAMIMGPEVSALLGLVDRPTAGQHRAEAAGIPGDDTLPAVRLRIHVNGINDCLPATLKRQPGAGGLKRKISRIRSKLGIVQRRHHLEEVPYALAIHNPLELTLRKPGHCRRPVSKIGQHPHLLVRQMRVRRRGPEVLSHQAQHDVADASPAVGHAGWIDMPSPQRRDRMAGRQA